MKTLTEIQKELAELSQRVRDVSNDVVVLSRAQNSGDDGAARVARLMRSLDGLAKPEPLVVPELASMDEHFREVALRVLCSVTLYENIPTADQILWLQRIASGMKVSGRLEEYTRQAMELNPDTLGDFLPRLAGASSRYYFMLDGLILAALGENPQSGLKYMSELANAIKIPPEDAKHIAFMAKAVVTQNWNAYRMANRVATIATEQISFAPYMLGALGTRENYTGPTHFENQDEVILDGYAITVSENWHFDSCKSVTFRNCSFKGTGKAGLYLRDMANFKMINCDVSGFTYTLYVYGCTSMTVEGCKFEDCEHLFYCGISSNDERRARITFNRNRCERCNEVCSVRDLLGYFTVTIDSFLVTDSEFIDCRGEYGGLFRVSAKKRVESGNTIRGVEAKIFNN